MLRSTKYHEPAPARLRHAMRAPSWPRHRCRGPLVLHLCGQPSPKFTNIPRTRDVHRKVAAGKLLVHIRNVRIPFVRREALLEQTYVEFKSATKLGRLKIS